MATKIFPSANDINGGVSGDGKTLKEKNFADLVSLVSLSTKKIFSGFTLPSSDPDLTISISAGSAIVAGRYVIKDAAENLTLTASATNHIYLQVVLDASSNATAANFVANTTGIAPANSIKLGVATTNASATTSISSAPVAPGIIVPPDAVDVRDFGAVGDGITDDTTKIQAAIDYLGTAGGRIFFPRGTYLISATLKFETGTQFYGIGYDSLIKAASLAAPLFQSKGGSTSRRYRLVMRDLGIDNTTTIAGGIGIDLRNVTEAKISNVFINNVDIAVQLYADAGLGCYYNTLTDVSCSSCTTGFFFGQLANENRLVTCRTNNTSAPVILSDGSHNHIISPSFEQFGTYGINVNGPAYDTLILSPRLENAPTSGTGIRIVASAVRTTVIAPQYTGLTTNLSDSSTDSVFLSGQDGFRFGSNGVLNKYHRKITATVDLPSSAANDTADLLVSIPGVLATDSVFITSPPALPRGIIISAIPANGGVYIRNANVTVATIDVPSLTYTIDIWGN